MGVLTEKTLNKLALMGLAALGVRIVPDGNMHGVLFKKTPAIPDPRMSRITWIEPSSAKTRGTGF